MIGDRGARNSGIVERQRDIALDRDSALFFFIFFMTLSVAPLSILLADRLRRYCQRP